MLDNLPLPLRQLVCRSVIPRTSGGARLRILLARRSTDYDVRGGLLGIIPEQNVFLHRRAEAAVEIQRLHLPTCLAKGLRDTASAVEEGEEAGHPFSIRSDHCRRRF